MKQDNFNVTILNSWVSLVETNMESEAIPYFHLKVPDYVFILAISNHGMVPLVKQYRMPLKRESLELPAGLVENNEEPRNAAVKELLEETGVKYFRDLIEMPPMILDSGRIENLTYGFLALGVELPTESQQSNAELNTIWLSSETLISHAMSGKIDHMGQVALILWASQAGYI